MNLAFKDIRHNLGRFVLTAVGIGLLLMTVMGMGGIYRGLIEDATLLIEKIGADLWIVQAETKGPFAELSRIPVNIVDRVTAVPGIQSARQFVYHTIQRSHAGRSLRIAVLGLDWPRDTGAWLPLRAGRPLAQARKRFPLVPRDILKWALENISDQRDLEVGTQNQQRNAGKARARTDIHDARAVF